MGFEKKRKHQHTRSTARLATSHQHGRQLAHQPDRRFPESDTQISTLPRHMPINAPPAAHSNPPPTPACARAWRRVSASSPFHLRISLIILVRFFRSDALSFSPLDLASQSVVKVSASEPTAEVAPFVQLASRGDGRSTCAHERRKKKKPKQNQKQQR